MKDQQQVTKSKIASKNSISQNGQATPTNSSARLSASKASFFSVAPTVVSLDPWAVFGMGNKSKGSNEELKEEQQAEDKQEKEKERVSVATSGDTETEEDSVRNRKNSENSRKEDISSRDNATDISENLEYDWKLSASEVKVRGVADPEMERRRVSEAGSLDDLNEDLNDEDVFENGYKATKNGSAARELGGEGDDEGDDLEDEEMLEKTAVTYAMEQLLKDIDHKNVHKDSVGGERILKDSSDSGENESFVEGRHSPSASKTRKFRMKRNARQNRSKGRQSARSSITTDSEAARTDPTTTDTSQPRSSMSRSPSADVEWNGGWHGLNAEQPVDKVNEEAVVEKEECDVNEIVSESLSNVKAPTCAEIGGEGEKKLVSLEEKPTQPPLATEEEFDTDINEIELGTQTTGNDTLRQVLESVAAMPDLSEPSDLDELVLANIDDRFVTDRRKKRLKLTKKPRRSSDDVDDKERECASVCEGDHGTAKKTDSSFSISTPSVSETSVSSLDEDMDAKGMLLDVASGEEDAPDTDMLKDYQTTMSMALGESYSEDEKEEVALENIKVAGDGINSETSDLNSNAAGIIEEKEHVQFKDSDITRISGFSIEMKEHNPSDGSMGVYNEGLSKVSNSPNNLSTPTAAEKNEEHDDDTMLSSGSSVYATPEVNIDKRLSSGLGFLNKAELGSPIEEDSKTGIDFSSRNGITSPKSTCNARSHFFTSPPVPVSLSPESLSQMPSGTRESSSSDIFLSPLESLANSPANLNVETSRSFTGPLAQSSPVHTQPKATNEQSSLTTQPKSSSTSSSSSFTISTPSSSTSSLSSRNMPTTLAPSTSEISKTPQASTTTKPHRKLPDLPKLKLPSMPAVKSTALVTSRQSGSTAKTSESKQPQVKSTVTSNKRNQNQKDTAAAPATKVTASSSSSTATVTSSKSNKPISRPISSKTKPLEKMRDSFDPPVSSSSPKLPSKSKSSLGGGKNSSSALPTTGRALPKPNLSSLSAKTKTKPSDNRLNSALPVTSTSSSRTSTSSSTTKKSSAAKPSTTTTAAQQIASTSTSIATPKITKSSSKPPPTFKTPSDKPFSQPVSPPVFHPPQKTVVPIDHSRLRLGSSTETADSESEVGQKKKISAVGVSIGKDIDDIPFADEGDSEAKFYTPCAPDKRMQVPVSAIDSDKDSPRTKAKKRMLPNPPSSKSANPGVLTADQIREIRAADREKAKYQARERARLKSDEELGISEAPASSKILSRNNITNIKNEENQRRSESFDTLSTGDVLSDSDDKLSSSVQSPISSAAEQLETPKRRNAKKIKEKKNHNTDKGRRAKKEKKEKERDTDMEKKEKRKSLLALILPGKSSDKSSKDVKISDSASTDNTPKGSDNDNTKSKDKHKGNKSDSKLNNKSGQKAKHNSNLSNENSPEKTPVLEYKKDLAICSVFHSDALSKPKNRLSSMAKKDARIAPKASSK